MTLSDTSALKAFISRQPQLTEADQAKLLVDLFQAEVTWRSEMIAAYGFTAYEHLPSLNPRTVLSYFRLRQHSQTDLFGQLKAKRWDEISKLGINYPFVLWSHGYIEPTAAMGALEAQIVAIRHRLAESLLGLALKQARSFVLASKTRAATLDDFIALGVEGCMDGIDKYVPDGDISARSWKSVVLGRISGMFGNFLRDQTSTRLYSKDRLRLAALRGGRVPEDQITDDDLQLQGINVTRTIATTASAFDDEGNQGFDLPDSSMNPEELLIWREEQEEREKALALRKAKRAPK